MVLDFGTILTYAVPLVTTVIGYAAAHWLQRPASPGTAPPRPSLPTVNPADISSIVAAVVEKLHQRGGAAPSTGQTTHPILDALAALVAQKLQPAPSNQPQAD